MPGCKVSPLVWSIFVGQKADLTSGLHCTGEFPRDGKDARSCSLRQKTDEADSEGSKTLRLLWMLLQSRVLKSCMGDTLHIAQTFPSFPEEVKVLFKATFSILFTHDGVLQEW